MLAGDVVGAREELEIFDDDHVLVRPEEIRDVADQGTDFSRLVTDHVATDAGLAPGGLKERRQNLDGGGFSSSVGPDVAEALALLDGELEVVEGNQFAVLLGEIDGLNDHFEVE